MRALTTLFGVRIWWVPVWVLFVALVGVLPGCENRKKHCARLYQRVAACAPADHKPSARARLDFIAGCQKEYDGPHVKRTRACVAKHSDCAGLQKCLVKKLKLEAP
jgi:uncharacterized protein YgiB involved in biofilm formation